MADDQTDPTEREHVDEDLEMDGEQAEDVKGGGTLYYGDGASSPTSPTGTIGGSLGGTSGPTKYKPPAT